MTERPAAIARPEPSASGPHFTAVDLGALDDLSGFETPHPLLGRATRGRVFLQQALGATGIELSFNAMPPRAAVPFTHAHRENEELYLFLGGEGEMLVDGQVLPVREGSCVRCAPQALRAWRNVGAGVLSFAVLQVRADAGVASEIEDGVAGESPAPWPAD
ncbi:cupin domain-containing protein [Engelhardtia mirabilis]|uniref:Cupin domain protein n=1 Tax=Engelhardtia mirabilis TaxID=2528011 RepID=A0A518BEX2_9BACT|nr:Cupin domain protein [Planctomycetes bacterium Pla133]QDU99860.1 Cupin domain protein [Planctomycetes bacterium Pla86]